MSKAEELKSLVNQLRERVSAKWVGSTGGPCTTRGYVPDALCVKAADTIDAQQSTIDKQRAEIERLTKDAERAKLLGAFLKRQGLLVEEFCRPAGRETKTGGWWLLWPVYMVDKTKRPLGYGNSETEAIDAAIAVGSPAELTPADVRGKN